MKYDFDRVVSRKNTNCAKWDAAEILFREKDVIPMWVADMDIPIAKPITEAIRKRTEHEIYGYPFPAPASTVEATISRIQRKYKWSVEPEWIVFTPGVVPALFAAVRAFTRPGDSVLLQGPVYYPFWSAVENNGCHVANNQLKLVDGRYEIDFDDMESQFLPKAAISPSPNRTRMMIMCNPHNPVARVFTRQELTRMGEILLKNKAIMVSDEIHCELLFKGYEHTTFASLSKEFEQNSMICLAPSKTFNLAGLGASVIIIPNADLRRKFNQTRQGIQPGPSVLSMVALEAAYRDGDEWLEQFLEYMNGNLELMMDYFLENIPEIKVVKPEGTYLIWLDCRALGMDAKSLKIFMRKEAKLGLEDGFLFGPSGTGFVRMNIACTRATLNEAMRRLEKAVVNYKN
ncbi:MAG: pyridoxal phosphate-dependent aminotransferase [Proteobacteria bacterium]|nr:pyridoxal phosphate-dependent aminotransferase [Pseudomonadota bacterium]